jgi:hypothetical protein
MKLRRVAAIASLLAAGGLAGCGMSPASLGVTGPGNAPKSVAKPTSDDAELPVPGIPPQAGETYSPSLVPTYGQNGRYYGSD